MQAGGEHPRSAARAVVPPDRWLGETVNSVLNRHPSVGLAVGVVREGRLDFFHGHGLAHISSRTPVTEDTVFRIGSVTKTVTAVAVLQLAEQGRVDLDTPAARYLRAYRIVPARPWHRAPTLRELLTHTSGLPQLVYPSRALRPILGETVPFGRPVPTLTEFYRGRLNLVAEPGSTYTYSNHGFATLGQVVEDVSGIPLERYLREYVFDPSGMADTDLVRTPRLAARLATGYAIHSRGPSPVADQDLVTRGAGGIYSTTRDMTRYAAALSGAGSSSKGSVLSPEGLAAMTAPSFRADTRLPGVGLAFVRRDLGDHLVVEHEGLVPGFSSYLAVAPTDHVAVVAFTNGARGAHAWLGVEMLALLGRLLGAPDTRIRSDVAHHPEVWPELCGRYAFRGSWRDIQRWFVSGAEVTVTRGRLVVRAAVPIPALVRGLPLHPDDESDPDVYRVDLSGLGLGTSRVVFSRAPGLGVTGMHLEFSQLSFNRRTRSPGRRGPGKEHRT